MNPAPVSIFGSRVVTTRATRTQTTPAAAKNARFVMRSRASITGESRGWSVSSRVDPPRIARSHSGSGDRNARSCRRESPITGWRAPDPGERLRRGQR